jgi:hypothetical protein
MDFLKYKKFNTMLVKKGMFDAVYAVIGVSSGG